MYTDPRIFKKTQVEKAAGYIFFEQLGNLKYSFVR
jgi:hypothetical protein